MTLVVLESVLPGRAGGAGGIPCEHRRELEVFDFKGKGFLPFEEDEARRRHATRPVPGNLIRLLLP